MAKIHFKYGAMKSGKSDTLIKAVYNYRENGLDVVIIKPSIDTKGGKFIVTRSGNEMEINILSTPDTDMRQAIKKFAQNTKLKKLSCVLIDEAQFLTAEQVDQLYDVAKIDKISVIAYGLRADFRTELFPGSKRLFEVVDSIEKLPTMCLCGSQAEFNCRMDNGRYVFEGDQVAIDGDKTTTYCSLCGNCYKDVKKSKQPKPQHLSKSTKRILKAKEGN